VNHITVADIVALACEAFGLDLDEVVDRIDLEDLADVVAVARSDGDSDRPVHEESALLFAGLLRGVAPGAWRPTMAMLVLELFAQRNGLTVDLEPHPVVAKVVRAVIEGDMEVDELSIWLSHRFAVPTEPKEQGMFERFTDRARKVLVFAEDEARLLGHDFLGTEHVLLGMLHEGTGVAAVVLGQLGITLDQTRADVRGIIGSAGRPAEKVAFTPRAKRVLELGLQEALTLGHNYIGTEHLLLGLVAEGEGVGAKVLTDRGLSYAQVRKAVHDQLGEIGVAPAVRRTLNVRSFTRPLEMVRLRRSGIRRPQADPDFVAMCSFCGKRRDQVERLVAGPGVFICADCVQLCVEIINEDPQDPNPSESGAEGAEVAARCPACSAELEAELRRTTIGAGEQAVTVVHCGTCGTTLGVLPPENR
jgi:hypothetical protein